MPDDKFPSSRDRTAQQPEDCGRILIAALEAGDLDACVALYEADAVLLKKSGEPMTGHDAIRQANAALIALRPRFHVAFIRTTTSGDGTLAMTRMKAEFDGVRGDSTPLREHIHTLEVVRRQADGSWRYVIDDPYGSMREDMRERQG